jgi:succinoglycan biosynthesis protein ExoM
MPPFPETELKHIAVCICTYRRPRLLRRLLDELARQRTSGMFSFSIVVVDNDQSESAKKTVLDWGYSSHLGIIYSVEPTRNIALARNRALTLVDGALVAFIDDDEIPASDWMLRLYSALERYCADGVLGPVLPRFEQEPPRWIEMACFYDRPRHPTGTLLQWQQCRTGNVLLHRRVLDNLVIPFRPEFGTGGEDQDFFRRAIENGHRFIWCDDAVVDEIVLLSRALLRGQNSARHPAGRYISVAKSAIAVPVYCLILPVLLLTGQHRFMKYLVKLADHVGRLLATLGFHPVAERPM